MRNSGGVILWIMFLVSITVPAVVMILGLWYTVSYMDKRITTVQLTAESIQHTEPTVCRLYINQDGMMDVTSPSGEVEIVTTDNNIIVGDE